MASNGQWRVEPHVWDVVNRLFESFSRLKPAAPWEINIHSETLSRLNDLSDHRRLRLLSANSKVPPLLWSVLSVGTLIILVFSYFLVSKETVRMPS